MPHTSSTCLDLYGFPIKSSYGLSLLSKNRKKKERRETEEMLYDKLFLFVTCLSLHAFLASLEGDEKLCSAG